MSEKNVLKFRGMTKAPVPVDRVLEGAGKAKWENILVLGHDQDGNLNAFGSHSDKALLCLLLDQFKHNLLSGLYDPEEEE